MALRIRPNGDIFCAALSQKQSGDTYIDDNLHYQLSVIHRVLVTEDIDNHLKSGGRWWWGGL